MKIALCSDSFLPVVDGVGRVVYEYASRLPKADNECYVITPISNSGYRGKEPFEILDYLSISPQTARYKSGIPITDPHYLERIRDKKFDLVHIHTPGTSGIEGVRIAEKYGLPLVGTFHSKYYNDILKVTKSELLSSVGVKFIVDIFERCDEMWTVSNHAAQTLEDYGYKGNIRVIYNGNSVFKNDMLYEIKARNEYMLTDEPILLYVGQIDKKKNIGRIIEAAAVLRKKGRRFQLVLAGKGPDEDVLREYANELGAGRVIFTGHIYDKTLLSGLYMAASMFMFLSEYDTAGLVVGEAALAGTPSVVIRNSAPAEFVTNKRNGFVVIDQANDIADVVENYVFNMSDEQKNRIKKAAREEIPMSWDVVMKEVEERYKALIHEKNYE